MDDLTQKYLDKQLVNEMPEVLPPDYQEWLDTQEPAMPELEAMAKAMLKFDDAMNKVFGKSVF